MLINKESRVLIERAKKEFPTGTRVVCVHMEDVRGVPDGTEGTVFCVDDIGTIHVDWDTGGNLGFVLEEAFDTSCIKKVN